MTPEQITDLVHDERRERRADLLARLNPRALAGMRRQHADAQTAALIAARRATK